MKKGSGIAIVMALLIAVFMAGCGGGNKTSAPIESSQNEEKIDDVVNKFEVAEMETAEDSKSAEYAASAAESETAEDPEAVEYIEVTADISVSGEDGKPVFTIKTNLPDETVIQTELSFAGELENIADDYVETQDVVVRGGTAQTEAFTRDGEALTGEYLFAILVDPSAQSEQVQEIIGSSGEALTGELIESIENYHYMTIGIEYISPFGRNDDKISEEELEQRFAEALAGFDGNYELTLDGYVYTVNIWGDGVAETATLANLGDSDAKKTWDKLVTSTTNTQIALQNMMDISGYDDYMVVMQIVNNLNRENVLLTVFLGIVTYNCVS